MDPLSITASCITVVATGGIAIKGLKKLRDLTKIPDLLLSIINEVADLTLVLHDVRMSFQQDSSQVSQAAVTTIEHLLDQAQATLLKLDQIINYRLLKLPKDNGELVFSRSAWMFEERRVQQLRSRLRTTRLNITARFAALNLTRTLHLEIRLQGFTLMIQNLLDSNLSESHTIRTSQNAMQEQLLASLHRLQESQGRTQINVGNLNHTANIQSQALPQNSNRCLDSRHERSQAHPLSPHAWTGSSSIAGMKIQQIERTACRRNCSCQCHIRMLWRSHPMLNNIIGSLFLGYYRTPKMAPKCDSPSCHGYQRVLATVFYVFPHWFLQRIVLIAISYATRDGLGISIRTIRKRCSADSIWIYVTNGDLVMIQSMFKRGEASPFDVITHNGESILESSITYQHIEISRFLLAQGADPDFAVYLRHSPATTAWNRILANDGDAGVLTKYRQLFCDTGNLDGRNFSTLHRIVLYLDGRDLKTYLQSCPRTEIDQVDDIGRTALHWAARRGDLANAELLLRHGANPNIIADLGANSLHCAAVIGHVGIIDLCLKYGVDVNQSDSYMATPLMMACNLRRDSPTCVKRLIRGGAEVNVRDRQGATALMYAAYHGSPRLSLQHLLQYGALVNMQNLEGETALILALQGNSHEAIPILISHAADTTHHTPSKRSLLHTAAKYGNEATLVILTSVNICEIDVNCKDKDGATAWDLARARNGVSPEWRAAFADLVASVKSLSPEPTADSDSELSLKTLPIPRVRLSNLIRIAEDEVYRWVIQVHGYLNARLQVSFSAGFLMLVVVLAVAWRMLLGS